ncbi:unnamed protein product [Pleuronectes platessa]|uniref:Uncharacterized protein n=1 Tax=Pleuronectes platessa TaxID=8262 RepID=A0A9N7VJ10_PLEPL|nr:unnamed protein product [Pleuronectes platessa]
MSSMLKTTQTEAGRFGSSTIVTQVFQRRPTMKESEHQQVTDASSRQLFLAFNSMRPELPVVLTGGCSQGEIATDQHFGFGVGSLTPDVLPDTTQGSRESNL